MAVKLEKSIKRELELEGRAYTITIAPEGVKVYNPAFDVTPNRLITGIVTEKGVIRPVNGENVRAVVG